MRKLLITLLLPTLCLSVFATSPQVTNVTSSQRTDGSKVVDVYYDLFDADYDAVTVSLTVSDNNGSSYLIIPASTNLSGDIGIGITSGLNKHIEWNCGAENGNFNGNQYIVKIIADDTVFSIPPTFVIIPGGTFNNGSSDVTISTFYMDKYELTQQAYQAVMGSNPASFNTVPNGPVENVTWFQAIVYSNIRSLNEGLTPCYSYASLGTNPADWPAGWQLDYNNHLNVACNWSANGYRLPTEMEWMFAAIGGNLSNNTTYSGSNSIESVAWYNYNADSTTHSVGQKQANELGLYDMSGNVWEWVWDMFGGYPDTPQTNPTGYTTGQFRVLRGGSINNSFLFATVARRSVNNAYYLTPYIGFRVCKRAY